MDTEVVFMCKKCEHYLFTGELNIKKIETLLNYDCPNCGEEPYQNWILSHIGNSEKEKDNYNWKTD